jgi:mannose-1-phosphate guanylyltransferase / mannose-6-phosphate isomerase
MKNPNQSSNLKEYQVGDSDERPWGCYVVTGLGLNDKGEEYCEKEITVNPGKILSLQSHKLRRELWQVKKGTLTVVLNDRKLTLKEGEKIEMPLGSIHCMANVESEPCVVYEKQEGVCREEDIIRYVDAYGRAPEGGSDKAIEASIARYNEILKQING